MQGTGVPRTQCIQSATIKMCDFTRIRKSLPIWFDRRQFCSKFVQHCLSMIKFVLIHKAVCMSQKTYLILEVSRHFWHTAGKIQSRRAPVEPGSLNLR